ncbi:MAG: NAD-dependent deacylase [Chitinophagales bacterium]|nr:NAD-dependent deacylase [Chitinophagaceae bacterium]MCB9064388.1 NAD-dependent deacylase [Chitinophagales bacterium]
MAKQVLVALTGAGISAESGLQTFRDSDGLWEGHRVEDVATPYAWEKDPEMVLKFYNMRRSNVKAAEPNAAHKLLANLQEFYDVHIVTQNIDDLHERAGSENVLHLHGEIFKMRSERNEGLVYPIREDIKMGDIAGDGAQLRPHIVWFGEPVHMIAKAIPIMQMADVFVLVGTSLVVYPAAGLIDYVGHDVKKYVLDRRIPSVGMYNNIIPIEKPATEGAEELRKLLL